MVKSRREKGKLNGIRQKGSKGRLQCCKCWMLLHTTTKLMHWLPVISEFWCNLLFNAQPPTFMFFGYHSEAAVTWAQPDMKTTKQETAARGSFEFLQASSYCSLRWKQLLMEKPQKLVCSQITIKALQPTPELNWLTLDSPEQHWAGL